MKHPLLLRQALPGFDNPLDPEELAGLALEEGVEARLVTTEQDNWRLQDEPLKADSFQRTGAWTLLVQGVDCDVPQMSQ